MGRDFKNGNGLFTSLFSGKSITSKDIQSINAMNQAMQEGKTYAQAWVLHMKGCTTAAKQQAKQCLINKGNLSDLTSELNQNTLSAKAAALGLKALSIAGNMLLFMAIGKAISFATEKITELIHASEIAREKSSELTNQWKEENSSIDQSISKYKELKEKLNDTSISASEIKSIKEELLGVQDDLVEKYGNEALQIDLVNGKYDEQIAKLEKLSKLKAQEYVAENYSNIQEDRKYVTEKVNLNRSLGFKGSVGKPDDFSNAGFDLKKYLDKYDKLHTKISGTGSQFGVTGNVTLVTDGTREEVYDQLVQLENDLIQAYGKENEDVNKFLGTLSDIINEEFDTSKIDEAKSNLKEYATAEIMSQDDTRKLYSDAIDAVEEYNEALQSGKGIGQAKANLESVQQSVKDTTSDIEGAEDVFNDIYSGINKTAESKYKVDQAFKDNKAVQTFSEKLRGLTEDNLKKIDFEDNILSPGEKAFGALIDILGLSEDEVQVLIDKLIELGVVQGNISDDFKDSSNSSLLEALSQSVGEGDDTYSDAINEYEQQRASLQSYLDKINTNTLESSDKLSLATEFGITGDSVDELREKIEKLMGLNLSNIIKKIDQLLSGSTLSEQGKKDLKNLKQSLIDISAEARKASPVKIDTEVNSLSDIQLLSTGLEQLGKIYNDVKDKEEFDWSSILNNESFTKEFGQLGDVYDDFTKQVSSAPDDIEECQKAFDDLATAYIYAAKDINGNSIMGNLTEETKDATIAMLEQMGVENAKQFVEAQLAAKVLAHKLAVEELDFANKNSLSALQEKISGLLGEADAAGITTSALFDLIAQENIFANTSLNVGQKMTALQALAEAFGITADAALGVAYG